ncbi:MAG: type II toxin-antitoxin system PemK/MazF family toxin [Niveispirillum sp.]|uniref:type II toxin-antitoxin system PemK/MazF family toxin n=1 Tax=Niveispirillum sp. TaxID=1917217 RepID=UPI003BA41D89
MVRDISGSYQPDLGDLVYINCDPKAGTEQGGRRPALVMFVKAVTAGTGLAAVVPITNQVKGGPLEVRVPPGCKITGVALPEHIRSVDWIERQMEFVSKAPQSFVDDVRRIIILMMGGEN